MIRTLNQVESQYELKEFEPNHDRNDLNPNEIDGYMMQVLYHIAIPV